MKYDEDGNMMNSMIENDRKLLIMPEQNEPHYSMVNKSEVEDIILEAEQRPQWFNWRNAINFFIINCAREIVISGHDPMKIEETFTEWEDFLNHVSDNDPMTQHYGR